MAIDPGERSDTLAPDDANLEQRVRLIMRPLQEVIT